MFERGRVCFWFCFCLPALLTLCAWTTGCAGMFSAAEALQSNAAPEASLQYNSVKVAHARTHTERTRTKRGAIWNFFQKVGITMNLVADQFVDTKDTLNEVYNMVNSGFSDPAPDKPTLRPSSSTSTTIKDTSSSEEVSTTEKYQISRYEFGRILGRNFRGLQRLTHIELQDAFNQSKYNLQEYQAEARKQFSNSIAVEKKNQLREQLKG